MDIFDDFDSVSAKQWKQKIQFELNGLDYNETLLYKTVEGISINPFYTLEDHYFPLTTRITENIANNTPKKTDDIIGKFAKNGKWERSKKEDFIALKKKLSYKNSFTINISIYQNAGANIVQQLAYALAITQDYVSFYDKKIVSKICFQFAIGSNFFFEIAKLRAIHILWESLLNTYQVDFHPLQVYTESSIRNKKNNETDIFKRITEQHCASLGRTNHHTSLIKKLDSTRNNNIDKNYSNGSFYIEHITKELCEKALIIFKQIEQGGGFLKQLEQGVIQRKIKESEQKEQTISHPHTTSDKKIINPKNHKKTIIEPVIPKKII